MNEQKNRVSNPRWGLRTILRNYPKQGKNILKTI